MIDITNFTDVPETIRKMVTPFKYIMSIGCGKLPLDRTLGFETCLAIDISENVLNSIKDLPGVTTLLHDFSKGLPIVDLNKFDTITFFDSLEHITKEEGLSLLDSIESKFNGQIVIFIPIQKSIAGDHKSIWMPFEFAERGYSVEVSPEYHKKKECGAMICIRRIK